MKKHIIGTLTAVFLLFASAPAWAETQFSLRLQIGTQPVQKQVVQRTTVIIKHTSPPVLRRVAPPRPVVKQPRVVIYKQVVLPQQRGVNKQRSSGHHQRAQHNNRGNHRHH